MTMTAVDIHVKDNEQNFVVGDTVSGVAKVTLPVDLQADNVTVSSVPFLDHLAPNAKQFYRLLFCMSWSLNGAYFRARRLRRLIQLRHLRPLQERCCVSFHCVGEVNWIEYPGTAHYLNGYLYFDKYVYYEEMYRFSKDDIEIDPFVDHKKVHIRYAFTIPKDTNLPSTMTSDNGTIRYYVQVSIQDKDELKKFTKEVNVQAPLQKNLMITVSGTVEKTVLLHGGTVSMHASIARKGFAPGEPITVHIRVNNKTNTSVVPRISLKQVQIYMCGIRHKTIENTFPPEPITGSEIVPQTEVEEVLSVTVPIDESLSIKSLVITVKYFVNVTLDIPHSFDLHLNLPVVLTTKKALDALKQDNKPLKK